MDPCNENQAVIPDPTTEDSMEAAADQQDQLYGTNTSLILDPTTISINGSDNDIVTTASVSAADVATTGAIAIGSQMYIIQSDPSQSAEGALNPHAFVLQPEMAVSVGNVPTTQGEAVTMHSVGEESAVGDGSEAIAGVSYMAEQAVAVEDSSVATTYQNLSGAEEGVTGVVSPGLGSSDQGETITLSLEEATQLLLHQGLEGTAIQMPDGSYQLLSQQLIQVTKEDGTVESQPLPVEVVQALSGGMMGYAGIEGAQVQEGVTPPTVLSSEQVDMEGAVEPSPNSQDASQTTELMAAGVPGDSPALIKQEIKQELLPVFSEQSSLASPQASTSVTSSRNLKVSVSASGSTMAILETPEATPVMQEVAVPKPDFNCPIEVTERTEVMIKGKKCVLMQNPETKQLCAYPILPPQGRKRRGRPRKVRSERAAEDASPSTENSSQGPVHSIPAATETPGSVAEKATPIDTENSESADTSAAVGDQNSAAEGLLELSNAGPDSVRRSARKRKKAKVLEDYDVLEASSEEEGNFNDDEKDPDVTMYGVKRQKVKREPQAFSNAFMMPVKRGRGRPRRYPPRGQSSSSSSIPAVILPSANGQTLVMAPLQGLQNIPGLQSQVKAQLQQLIPKTSLPSAGDAAITASTTPLSSAISTTAATTTAAATATITTSVTLGPDGDASLPVDASAMDEGSIMSTSLPAESLQLGGESSDTQEGLDAGGEKERGEGDGSSADGQQHTVIQIPDNLLPMFGIKKESSPVKIGLKASESELEKLKCPKCEFQAYYPQQYQDHIATHAEDIHKCKCCNYLTFDKDDLLEHFKATHPRCICNVCEFMAEHAYMIKRHMMRHNADGCTCELCGKVYKDQYILKMHVKMVHMPAEVLFECTVCGKKFTRKAHLKRHLRIHEPEKPFKCPHCDYRGCERSDISKHLLIHEEPKHVCEVCQKAFRHIKNKELHVKRHNGQRDYKCGVCDFYGYTFTDIRKHIERKHADIKTVSCEKCSMHFKCEQHLREHQKDCDVMMIERALAIHTSNGGSSQATIQIPSSFAVDGQQITIDGQQIAVDGGHLNITVEHVPDVSLEDQMVETTIADIVTSSGHVIENADQAEMSDGTVHIIPNDDIEEEEEDLPDESMVHLE
ncbi:uncharacterized protein LOC143282926 [Babylonia areolata]|uniref:uncharacterized protein LOC143282926 n=1 Tax=Babylonia areolata TaxID=304850 RepID=UPI003FD5CC9C